MLNDVRLEYDVHWMLDPEQVRSDPFNQRLQDLGRYLMYRSYLAPTQEMIAERLLDMHDVYYVHEIHYLKIPHGQYTIRLEDPSNKIRLQATNIRMNGSALADLSFNI